MQHHHRSTRHSSVAHAARPRAQTAAPQTRPIHCRPPSRLAPILTATVLSLPLLGGCATGWHYTYDDALRRGRRENRDVLIFFKDPLDPRSGRARDALKNPAVAARLDNTVRALLVPSYPPNRDFLARYGITDTPALLLIHPDGTYHRLNGVHTSAEIIAFLDRARPPGRKPKPNPDPALTAGRSLHYFNIYERADEQARRQSRPLVIVYKWWLDAPSTELIRRLSKPEVARYLSETVNCILDWDYIPNRAHLARFGVKTYPALVVVEPSGRFRVMTGLPNTARLIKFLRADR